MLRYTTDSDPRAALREVLRESAARKSKWCFRIGFTLAPIGFVLCIVTGVHNDFHNLVIPAAQVGAMLLVGGLITLGCAVAYDISSRRE